MSEFVPVGISDHFNCRATSRHGEEIDAGFSAGGTCFPAEQFFTPGSTVTSGEVPFLYSSPDTHPLDNIECAEQRLSVDPGRYTRLWIMGACDNGSFADYLELEYSDGSAEQIRVGLSDWLCDEPEFGEQPVTRCPHSHAPSGRDLPLELALWCCPADVNEDKELVAVRLPDNPSMHMFALTLEPGGVTQ